jgi:hypothetical protein
MTTTTTTVGWDRGRFSVERLCDCNRAARASECRTAGWHMVASSDDFGDALGEADRLRRATDVQHRVVDSKTGAVS